VQVGETELAGIRARDAALGDAIDLARRELAAAERGEMGDPRAHLRHDQRPQPEEVHRYGRIVELWSAVSAGALLIFIVSAIYLGIFGPVATVVVAVVGYIVIEAATRRRLIDTILRATLVLAVIGAIVLAFEFLPLLLVVGIAGIALLAIVDNLRELRT